MIGMVYLQTHGVESHITWHGSIKLFWANQERDGLGHFFRVQSNGSSTLRLHSKTMENHTNV